MKQAAGLDPGSNIVMLGPVAGPRHDGFVAACVDRIGHAPRCIGWDAFLADPARLAEALRPGDYLRIDTPDQDVAAIAALYRAGEAGARAAGIATITAQTAATLGDGGIGSPGQLAYGLAAAVALAGEIARGAGAMASTTAADVALAFDKTATLARLAAAGIPVPRVLAAPCGFDALAATMVDARAARVFVKLRHGSAAAGMIALARDGDRWAAITTAEQDERGDIHATRAVRRLTDRAAIARLVDRLAPLGLHVEGWLPKIGIGGRVADLRLVMIDGGPVFPVLRTSRHPMTNLHLGGERGPPDALIARIGDAAWDRVLASARAAAQAFPSSHVLGLDVAMLADGRGHAVIEANAFGDFVRDMTVDGIGPHAAQADAIARRIARSMRAAA